MSCSPKLVEPTLTVGFAGGDAAPPLPVPPQALATMPATTNAIATRVTRPIWELLPGRSAVLSALGVQYRPLVGGTLPRVERRDGRSRACRRAIDHNADRSARIPGDTLTRSSAPKPV